MKRKTFEAMIVAAALDYAAWFAEHHPELFDEETASPPSTEPTTPQPPVAAPQSPTPDPEEARAAADEKATIPAAAPSATAAFRQRRARFRCQQ